MAKLSRTRTVLTAVRRSVVASFLGLAGAAVMAPAGAAITSYELSGIFYEESIYDAGGDPYTPTTNNVEIDNNLLLGVDFTLSFDLEDSVSGAPIGTNGSVFASAISSLLLTFDGGLGLGWDAPSDDAYAFANTGNHQWSIFSGSGSQSTDIEFLEVFDLDQSAFVESLSLVTMDLLLLDFDELLFSMSPPELVAFDGTEFESSEIELLWYGDNSLYDYRVFGGIDTITAVSAVPLPGAFWLFGSALLGMVGVARRRKL